MAKSKRPALTRRLHNMYLRVLAHQGDQYLDHEFCWRRHYGSFGSGMESNAWAAYYFARRWGGRDIDLARLQNIVARYGSGACLLAYASNVRGANVRKLQFAMVERGTVVQLRAFAKLASADAGVLERTAVVREVLAM